MDDTIQIYTRISAELAARLEAYRASWSPTGRPEDGPAVAGIMRSALANFLASDEERRRVTKSSQ